MAENFYTMLTIVGKNKLSSSAVSGSKVNFKTLKVGDGKGAYYEPSENQTSLMNQVWEGNISSISIDENNSNWIVVETVIPASDGGFFIREAGIFDEDGDMIAISKLAETYKPVAAEGSTKDLVIRIVLEVLNVDTVTIKIDPNVVAATKNDVQVLEAKVQDVSAQLSDLAKSISNDAVLTPTIAYGMNNKITNSSSISNTPKFTIQGNTVINLLGKDGNCEDVSKWLTGGTITLDSANKVFGTNGIRLTLNSTANNVNNPISKYNIDITKYYLVSVYLKNLNATNVQLYKDAYGGGNQISSILITDTTKFTRVGIVIQPSDFNANNYFVVNVKGVSTNSAVMDGFMINQITASEYALGADALLAKYPYVDSYTCLQNPYIEVRHDNLVRNGNGEEGIAWWATPSGNIISVNASGGFNLAVSTAGVNYVTEYNIPVKPNTNYYISANLSNITTQINNSANTAILASFTNNGTFNSGSNSSIQLLFVVSSSFTGIATISNIMLIEGTTAPTEYKSCRVERVVLETKLTSDDSVTYENGEVTGLINWKHKTLYGKDYDWAFSTDLTGYKQVAVPVPSDDNGISNSQIAIKYDGKIMSNRVDTSWTGSDQCSFNMAWNYDFQLAVADSDTGWSETINPNNDEVKAFMNGWKAIAVNTIVGRYVGWVSIVDYSLPPAVNTATVSTTYTSGSSTMVVSDGSKFLVGDYIIVSNGTTGVLGLATVSAISGNTLTLGTAIGYSIAVGALVYRCDNGSSDTRILNYCKSNISSNFDGYQLNYKLANPEPVNDDNCHLHGDIPKFDVGDNYLYLDSGMVLGEVANVQIETGTEAQLNKTLISSSLFKNKVESILTNYKNLKYDSSWSIITDSISYGNVREHITLSTGLYDANATYTVDYKILATQAPQIGTIGCSYSQDMSSAINNLQEEINNRQEHDSILDEIVDLSLYEKQTLTGIYMAGSWVYNGGTLWATFFIPFMPKKVIPVITISNLIIQSPYTGSNIDITNKFYGIGASWYGNMIKLNCSTNDTTTIANIKNYGVEISQVVITADCRGRI